MTLGCPLEHCGSEEKARGEQTVVRGKKWQSSSVNIPQELSETLGFLQKHGIQIKLFHLDTEAKANPWEDGENLVILRTTLVFSVPWLENTGRIRVKNNGCGYRFKFESFCQVTLNKLLNIWKPVSSHLKCR